MNRPMSEALDEAVARLVQGLRPERIYLFGSHVKGEADEGSDIDLLVILPQSNLPRHRREALAYQTLWGLAAPLEVVVLTRSEFDRTRQVRTSLASSVLSTGKMLYG